ncbi:MAG: NAD(P)-dependent oxidoreductase [Acetobacteraceae bacterium]|nr:NAD(P)-dependent oxidoreductase [Acetobacteraceae bacterium]
MTLRGKTVFMSGGSRGIGLAIAKRLGQEGANVAIAAKTDRPDPRLPGTIHSAAAEIEAAGGRALPLICDIRDESAVATAVARAVETFGGIDIVVNNASAIRMTGTLETPVKRYDLMHGVNGRGTFVVTQACLPHLLKAENPHILTLSPPLTSDGKWFRAWPAYTIAKYTMSLFTLAWSQEFAGRVAANALWPRTVIATAAVANEIGGEGMLRVCRKPEIVAEAALHILRQPATSWTGRFFIDDEVLIAAGMRDLSVFDVEPGAALQVDFFVEPLPGMGCFDATAGTHA